MTEIYRSGPERVNNNEAVPNSKSNYVDPPIWTMFDLEQLNIRAQNLTNGTLVHDMAQKFTVLFFLFEMSNMKGKGWTQEKKDQFLETLIPLRNRIIKAEEEKAKEPKYDSD